MTREQNDLTMRPITGRDELGLFGQLPYVLNEELADDLAGGRRRPEWMWVAVRGDRLLARAAWWSRSGADLPLLLVHSLRLDTPLLSVLATLTGDSTFLHWRPATLPVRVDSNIDVPATVYEHAVRCEYAHARLCQLHDAAIAAAAGGAPS